MSAVAASAAAVVAAVSAAAEQDQNDQDDPDTGAVIAGIVETHMQSPLLLMIQHLMQRIAGRKLGHSNYFMFFQKTDWVSLFC